MEIEVEPITIDDEECFKLRLGGILYGVFWSYVEALQYANSVEFNFTNHFSSPPVKRKL
jgi:hypothetical protein